MCVELAHDDTYQGWGVVATQDIDKGDMIIEYIGELVRKELSEKREREYNAKVSESTVLCPSHRARAWAATCLPSRGATL